MKKTLIWLFFLLLSVVSCNKSAIDKISREEYLVINAALNSVLKSSLTPNSLEYEEIAKAEGLYGRSWSEKDLEKFQKTFELKKMPEFSLSDTLFAVSAENPVFQVLLNSRNLKAEHSNLSQQILDSARIFTPDNYTKTNKEVAKNRTFVGKFQFGRIIFDRSGEKALVPFYYWKEKNSAQKKESVIFMKKEKNSWTQDIRFGGTTFK